MNKALAPDEEILDRAEKRMKADATLSFSAAVTKVMKADPLLAQRYRDQPTTAPRTFATGGTATRDLDDND